MKALKISFDHGRIWTVETSAGVRATGSTLEGVMSKLWPVEERPPHAADWNALESIFNGIRDSGGSGIARSGQVSG